ncbi:PEP/pyruvate-binding domain-containing protein [Arthrobacter sp. GCM10027362]|uniref:PEP/pyruvate-binding domain-containing protein n=1 Tax=Arthrobacter sp. GCM10027362 TaxID=3273379 RepID=UPI00362EED0D
MEAEKTDTSFGPYVQFFDGGAEPRHELLGGKCASLVALTAAGMPVPPGFAVTTAAYDAFIEEAGIRSNIERLLEGLDADDVAAVDKVSAQIRQEITSRPVPEAARQAVIAAWHKLQSRFSAPVPVAVRSSATAEDLPEASFAGQQDTYLWLCGLEEVTEHIRRCWASLYTSRAITYRLKNNIPNEGLSMAVAVQKMVNAKVAGVAITIDPTSGDRSKIVIDASYGVGEMVVSGQVTPDNIMVDKVMLTVVREALGDKHAELVPDPQARSLVEREVPQERRNVRCLSDAEVVAVATIAKRAEKHFKAPQDIEWALDADLPDGENLVLLQSRPETVHSSKPKEPKAAAKGFGIESITKSLMSQVGKD